VHHGRAGSQSRQHDEGVEDRASQEWLATCATGKSVAPRASSGGHQDRVRSRSATAAERERRGRCASLCRSLALRGAESAGVLADAVPRWPELDVGLDRFPIVRLRYTKTTGLWAIYWRDRNLKFHEYKFKKPSTNIQSLLDHIENNGDPIFWG